MRVASSIFIAVLAVFSLLAHDLIPHHHHDNEICFDYNHHDEHHLPEHQKDCCHISANSALAPKSGPQEISCLFIYNNRPRQHFEDLSMFFQQQQENLLSLCYLPFKHPPLLNESFLSYVCISSGMRAPPLF
jgi:hypothetical protein